MDFQFVLIGSGEKFKSLALGIENRVRTSRVFPWLKKSRGLFPHHFRARERGFRVFRGEKARPARGRISNGFDRICAWTRN